MVTLAILVWRSLLDRRASRPSRAGEEGSSIGSIRCDVPEAFDGIASPTTYCHLNPAPPTPPLRVRALVERLRRVRRRCNARPAAGRAPRPSRRERMVRRNRPFRLTAIDGSVGMLEQARRKTWPPGVSFEYRMAEDLSAAQADWGLTEAVGGIFAAYLFRNVADRDKVLKATHELLAPGGSLVIQEYSVAGSRGRASSGTDLLVAGDPAELAAASGDPALPLPVAECPRLRLGRGVRRAAVRGRVRRRGGPHGPGWQLACCTRSGPRAPAAP